MAVSAWTFVLLTSLLEQYERAETTLYEAENALRQIRTEQIQLAHDAARTQVEQVVTQEHLERYEQRLTRRLQSLMRNRQRGRALLFLDGGSFAEYLRSRRLLRWLSEHDRQLVRTQRREHAHFVRLQAEQAQRLNRLDTLAREAAEVRAEASDKRNRRVLLLAKMAQDDRRGMAVRQAKRSSAYLRQVLGQATKRGSNRGFDGLRGKLPWPATGKLVGSYGEVLDKRYSTTTIRNGILLETAFHEPVRSVARGLVVFSGWADGLGGTVIVDHGNNYHTVYGHLDDASIAQGTRIQAGTIVGAVGDAETLSGTTLYFEVRHQGRAQDPMQWLRSPS